MGIFEILNKTNQCFGTYTGQVPGHDLCMAKAEEEKKAKKTEDTITGWHFDSSRVDNKVIGIVIAAMYVSSPKKPEKISKIIDECYNTTNDMQRKLAMFNFGSDDKVDVQFSDIIVELAAKDNFVIKFDDLSEDLALDELDETMDLITAKIFSILGEELVHDEVKVRMQKQIRTWFKGVLTPVYGNK